jgi:hypothetical protein
VLRALPELLPNPLLLPLRLRAWELLLVRPPRAFEPPLRA